MSNYITYHSTNAPAGEEWCAYLTKFKVFCFGSTEQAAKDRAQAFYDKERVRVCWQGEVGDKGIPEGIGSAPNHAEFEKSSGHGNAGKVWMRHPAHGLKRMPANEQLELESAGWYRSGPRGK